MRVRMRPALLVVLAGTLIPASRADDAAWKLGPCDVAFYERRQISLTKDGKDVSQKVERASVRGHDLRDGGLYLPGAPTRDDLPAIFALRTPPAGAFETRVHVLDAVELRIKGTAAVTSDKPEAQELHVEATFASSGRAAETDEYELREGRASADIVFDRVAGFVKSAEAKVAYVCAKVDPKAKDKPSSVDATWSFTLTGSSRYGEAKFPADVNSAIDRGVAHLKSLEKADGSFEPEKGWDLGTTELGVYTLTSCGVRVDDPNVEKSLALICAATPTRTYEQAVGLMALERAYTPPEESALGRAIEGKKLVRDLPPERRAWCERTAAALEADCGSPGMWGYPPARLAVIRADASNTQYAVLGLQAASRLGIPVKEQTWTGVVRWYAQLREADAPRGSVALLPAGHAITETIAPTVCAKAAGFRYNINEKRTWGSMTCAAIGSLAVARDELRRAKSAKLDHKLEAEIDELVDGGWAWIDAHWAVDRHPGHPSNDWYYYWLYALERASVLGGVERVGGKDWYFEGASELLARQEKNGAWNEKEEPHTAETCFALLFLKRATAALTPK